MPWISLFKAADYFSSEELLVKLLQENEVAVRGEFYAHPSDALRGRSVPTVISREYLYNSRFNFEKNRISANANYAAHDWAANESLFAAVEVSLEDLQRAMVSGERPKAGRPVEHNHDLIRELFEIYFEVGQSSLRSFSVFVRARLKEEYPGENVPSFDTVRRVLRPLYRARTD